MVYFTNLLVGQADTRCIWLAGFQKVKIHRVFACFSVWTTRYNLYSHLLVLKGPDTPCICSAKLQSAKIHRVSRSPSSKMPDTPCIDNR